MLKPETIRELFQPMRGDRILYLFHKLLGGSAGRLAIVYIALALGGTVFLALMWGSALPIAGNKSKELFEDYGNLLNFGVIVPLGIFLVFNYYRRLVSCIEQVFTEELLAFESEEAATVFVKELDRRVNVSWVFFAALFLAVGLSVWISLNLKTNWNVLPGGGLPAIWFRIFAAFNFYVSFYMLFKGIATVSAIRFVFQHELRLQPLHPDRCSGLASFGQVSGAMNLFLALLMLYITILVTIDGIPLMHPAFLGVVLGFLLLATYVFIMPLVSAHQRMKKQKEQMLAALNRQFQADFAQIAEGLDGELHLSLEDIQRIETLERVHQITNRMPDWPINMESITKFMAVVVGPVVVGLSKLLMAKFGGK